MPAFIVVCPNLLLPVAQPSRCAREKSPVVLWTLIRASFVSAHTVACRRNTANRSLLMPCASTGVRWSRGSCVVEPGLRWRRR